MYSGSFSFKKPRSCSFLGQPVPCSAWKHIYTGVAAILARRHADFETKVQLLQGKGRPHFSKYPNGMHSPHRIDGTSLSMETTFSAQETMKRTNKLLEHFGYSPGDLVVTYE